jgi:ABC-type multidrug transport system fused ATPase/permease subunit
MSAILTFGERLRRVVVPTRTQVLGSFFLALAILLLAQTQSLLKHIGITDQALDATSNQFHNRFDAILQSSIASNIALVTFWALVGLVAYIICWGLYNIIIQARNEVTLTTGYANRGHWRGPYETMALKTLAAVGLALIVTSLWYGMSFWLALSAEAITQPSMDTAIGTLVAIVGLAFQLYAVLLFIQLTFTPWYRAETFTEL